MILLTRENRFERASKTKREKKQRQIERRKKSRPRNEIRRSSEDCSVHTHTHTCIMYTHAIIYTHTYVRANRYIPPTCTWNRNGTETVNRCARFSHGNIVVTFTERARSLMQE